MTDDARLEDVVTHRELAEFLGMSERSLSYFRLPSVQMGKARLYFRGSVAGWLKAREGRPGTMTNRDPQG
jgi:hypothetical protein